MADNQNPWLGYPLDNHIIFLISNAVYTIQPMNSICCMHKSTFSKNAQLQQDSALHWWPVTN